MAHDKAEDISIGWCDNGITDGRFTENLVYTVMNCLKHGLNIAFGLRTNGNQIGRQREHLLSLWLDEHPSEWLLWVDSDIVITEEIVHKLWQIADKDTRPIVTGTYFISMHPESSLMEPIPALFVHDPEMITEEHNPLGVKNIGGFTPNEILKVDYAGFGLILMHKSVPLRMREAYPNQSLFGERQDLGKKFVSEDIAFFEKMRHLGIPLYAHTGALVQHMKRFSFDVNYYQLYWANHKNILQLAKDQNSNIEGFNTEIEESKE